MLSWCHFFVHRFILYTSTSYKFHSITLLYFVPFSKRISSSPVNIHSTTTTTTKSIALFSEEPTHTFRYFPNQSLISNVVLSHKSSSFGRTLQMHWNNRWHFAWKCDIKLILLLGLEWQQLNAMKGSHFVVIQVIFGLLLTHKTQIIYLIEWFIYVCRNVLRCLITVNVHFVEEKKNERQNSGKFIHELGLLQWTRRTEWIHQNIRPFFVNRHNILTHPHETISGLYVNSTASLTIVSFVLQKLVIIIISKYYCLFAIAFPILVSSSNLNYLHQILRNQAFIRHSWNYNSHCHLAFFFWIFNDF